MRVKAIIWRRGMEAVGIGLLALACVQTLKILEASPRSPDATRIGDRLGTIQAHVAGVPVRIDLGNAAGCTLLVFSSPTCPQCQAKASVWDKEFGPPRNGVLISISDWKAAEQFRAMFGPESLPSLAAGEGVEQITRLGVLGVPRVLVIGRNGTVAAIGAGITYNADSLAATAGCP